MSEFVSHPLIAPNVLESRLYQEVLAARIVEKGNTLVVAPTALGKTVVGVLLAAFVLQKNFDQKIVFLSPTKPLAVQHEASFKKFLRLKDGGISLLTGEISPQERKEIWEKSKVISATPQTIENDILDGKIALTDVGLLVFDEAHRAIGDYSYVFIAKNYVKQAKSQLILGLTASPGSEQEHIQDVCRNLFIQNIEVKKPQDEDVAEYAKEIEVEWAKVDLPEKFLEIKKLLEIYMKEQLLFLKKLGYARSISSQFFGKKQLLLLQSLIRRDFVARAKENPMIYAAASRIAALIKVSHAHTLLETQGIYSLKDYFGRLKEQESKRASKAVSQILADDGIRKAMVLTDSLFLQKVNHPKLAVLAKILQKQFSKHPESRVLVFNHYRDSIKYLAEFLKEIEGVRAKRFIGQAARGSEKGMAQKEQIKTIQEFREGLYNTLLCSSVAEEGLDIPAVDLVVFFETIPSEIRTIQRRGRTGRFGKGKVIMLMAKGTRDETFYYVARAKEKRMQKTLSTIKGNLVLEKQSTLASFTDKAKTEVLVFVDQRERNSGVIKELSGFGAITKIKQLEVGDFVITDDIVIERKTINDFLESIIDGRLYNQLGKMASNYNSPMILVEGSQSELFTIRNIHRNAIIGTLTTIALNYRIPVIFTADAHETAEYIFVTAKREQLKSGSEIRLRVGHKGLSIGQQQRFIVESLPSVGPALAISLLEKFGSIKNIANASEQGLQEIENLGPKKARQIIRVLGSLYKSNQSGLENDE